MAIITALRETDETKLRQHLQRIIERAPLERLQTLAAYFEVAEAPERLSTRAAPAPSDDEPPVPASLVRPSGEVLLRQLTERAEANDHISAEEMFARIDARLR